VLITGGDGFIGWPTALRLSTRGDDVLVLDNFMRRRLAKSLTPIKLLSVRLKRWWELTGKPIQHWTMNVCDDFRQLDEVVRWFQPDAIIHLAVQPSAPYSMRDAGTRMETVRNNVMATTAVLTAAISAKVRPHIVHIGTMGVYGYDAAGVIPEGYIDMMDKRVLHPTNPGSLYHATKVMDQTLFAFHAKTAGLRITDLHQGIVWGTQTDETRMDDALINRFDYDGDFGTVVNRFLMQAAVGHPLTVYGTGGQTRAFININDTVRCLELALDSPPNSGEPVRIMNQMTEVRRVRDLANMVARQTGAAIARLDQEAAENDLAVDNSSLRQLGLAAPTLLADGLLTETIDIASRFAGRADVGRVASTANWRAA
jgi:UDP-sulfoquinovose synthase